MGNPQEWILPDQIAEWKLEPELASPIPRRVVLKGMFAAGECVSLTFLAAVALLTIWEGMLVGVLVMGCIVLGPIVIFCERERRLSKVLVSRGLAARGFIVHREVPTGEGFEVHFAIAYDDDTRRARFYLGISPPFGKRKERKPGETLTVLYLPEAPNRAKPYEDCVYKAV